MMNNIEELSIQVEAFAQDKLEQIKDAARIDKQIQAYAEKLHAAHNERFGDLAEREQKLIDTIEANKGWFVKPKSRKTTSTSFGLKAGKGSLTINNEAAVIAYAQKEGLQFVKVKETLDKEAVKAAIDGGEDVPGAAISGKKDCGFVTLKKGLVDAVRAPAPAARERDGSDLSDGSDEGKSAGAVRTTDGVCTAPAARKAAKGV